MACMETALCGAAIVAAAVGMAMMGCSGRDENAASPPPDGAAEAEPSPKPSPAGPVVIVDTSMGAIKVELWPDRTPETVANFLRYVDDGFYDGLIFHRVMDGFMIQGGGLGPDLQPKPTRAPIKNEVTADLRNDRGTIAMARQPGPHTASSQFFINIVDNDGLNQRDRTAPGFGYCPFGKVIEGMAVVDKIAKVAVKVVRPHGHVPVQPVVIRSMRRIKQDPPATSQPTESNE